METFAEHTALHGRFLALIGSFPGSLWSNPQHEQRMKTLRNSLGYRRTRNTNRYYAAMYLLTANTDIYRRSLNCFDRKGINFKFARLDNIVPHNYTLLMYARDIYEGSRYVSYQDLTEPEVIDLEAFRLIVGSSLILRYGLAALDIKTQRASYKR